MPQLVRGRRRTCDPPTCNRNGSADSQRLLTSFWELTMISRFHVYRYANCMLLYNISTLHHRDEGSFSRINFNDASLVGLPASRHCCPQGTGCAIASMHEQISGVSLRRIGAADRLDSRGLKAPQMFRDSSSRASSGRWCSTWFASSRGILSSLYRRAFAT